LDDGIADTVVPIGYSEEILSEWGIRGIGKLDLPVVDCGNGHQEKE
jgi:hypothetical protein